MRKLLLIVVAAIALPAFAETFQINVIYVCKGERVLITGCDVRDQSDAAYCQAEWRDRPQHNGFPAYTSETRGSMRKLIPTCTPPNAKQLETRARADKVMADGQKKAVDDQLAAFQAQQAKAAGPSADPGAIAARRCLAAGRSQSECITEGFGKSLKSLFGGTGVDTLMKEPAGLRLNGNYRSASGFAISFNPGTTSAPATATFGCGKLQPISVVYQLSFKDGVMSARIPNKPNPIPLTLNSSGRVTGPPQAVVQGSILVGWSNGASATQASAGAPIAHTETHMESRQIDYGEAHNGTYNATDVQQNGMEYSVNTPVTTTTYEEQWPSNPQPRGPSPIYKAKTETCTIGTMASTGSTAPLTGVAGMLDAFSGSNEKKAPPPPPGVRLVGNYKGPGDLQVEFRSDLALIDCGEVQLVRPYTIETAGPNLSVRMNNDGEPLALIYRPDGTLSGPASIHIKGRIVTGTTANGDITYAARSATCSLSTLAPQ